jgi:hypothetical protein
MAVAYVNKGTNTASTTSPASFALPASIVQGNVLVMIVGVRSNASVTTPGGWTLLTSGKTIANDTSGSRLYIFYKVAGASESAPSVSATFAPICGAILQFSGADGGTVAASAVATDEATTATKSTGTVSVNNGGMLIGAAVSNPNGTVNMTSGPSGFTNLGSLGSQTGDNVGAGYAGVSSTSSFSAGFTFGLAASYKVLFAVRLQPLATITHAVTGTLGAMTGAANITARNTVAAAGSLGAMSGAATVAAKDGVAAAGSLGKMVGSAAVSGLPSQSVAAAGSLGQVVASADIDFISITADLAGVLSAFTGEANVMDKDGVSVTGILGALVGVLDIEQEQIATVTGTLGNFSGQAAMIVVNPGQAFFQGTLKKMSGAAGIYLKPEASIAGILGQLKGHVREVQPIDFEGTMPPMSGDVAIYQAPLLDIAGSLGKMKGHATVSAGNTCYVVEDDRRELILARLAIVLGGVEGVVSFKRNDPTVVESQLPCVLLFDGDETASVPRGWNKGRPAPFPMLVAARPEVYLMVDDSDPVNAGATLNLLHDRIVKAVLNDSELQSLCVDQWLLYEGSQVAFALGRALEGEMGLNFTFNYLLDPKAVCAPLPDIPGFTADTVREEILEAFARAVDGAEGVFYFRRNEISRPEDASPAVFMLDGDEFVDPDLYKPGRPPNVPKPASADPEVYAVVNEGPETVGAKLNQLRLMVLRTVLNDPLLTRLAADGDIRYEGTQTGLALGRSMAGEMGLKFSVRYVLNP